MNCTLAICHSVDEVSVLCSNSASWWNIEQAAKWRLIGGTENLSERNGGLPFSRSALGPWSEARGHAQPQPSGRRGDGLLAGGQQPVRQQHGVGVMIAGRPGEILVRCADDSWEWRDPLCY
jgi:hypothetical protein